MNAALWVATSDRPSEVLAEVTQAFRELASGLLER
jgi:hypothetical protein